MLHARVGVARLAVSGSDYTNDQLSLKWIYHFDKHTVKSIIGSKQLLLLDEYKSHHIINFLQYCENNDIISFEFLSHTTHILQSLNVVVFQPYKHYHSKTIDIVVHNSCLQIMKMKFLSVIDDI